MRSRLVVARREHEMEECGIQKLTTRIQFHSQWYSCDPGDVSNVFLSYRKSSMCCRASVHHFLMAADCAAPSHQYVLLKYRNNAINQ